MYIGGFFCLFVSLSEVNYTVERLIMNSPNSENHEIHCVLINEFVPLDKENLKISCPNSSIIRRFHCIIYIYRGPPTAAGECIWLDLDLIQRVAQHSRGIFPVVRFAFSSVPTYPCGTIGYLLASNNAVSDNSIIGRHFVLLLYIISLLVCSKI